MKNAALLSLLLAVPAASADPVQNINANVDPTRPARLPSTYTGDPLQPTFPSADNQPPSRGGTIGDGSPPVDPQEREATSGPEELRRIRALPQSQIIAPAPGPLVPTSPAAGSEGSPD